jgi:hypothetical protein
MNRGIRGARRPPLRQAGRPPLRKHGLGVAGVESGPDAAHGGDDAGRFMERSVFQNWKRIATMNRGFRGARRPPLRQAGRPPLRTHGLGVVGVESGPDAAHGSDDAGRFMERSVFQKSDTYRDHEPGIPGGETPPLYGRRDARRYEDTEPFSTRAIRSGTRWLRTVRPAEA